MKEWNEKERWALAAKLDQILGADLMPDEEDALKDAIRLISPEFAEMMDEDIRAAAELYDKMTAEEMQGRYPPPSPDGSGTPVFNGKILCFGEEKEK